MRRSVSAKRAGEYGENMVTHTFSSRAYHRSRISETYFPGETGNFWRGFALRESVGCPGFMEK